MTKLLIILSLLTNLTGLTLKSESINQQISSAIRADSTNPAPIYQNVLPEITKIPVKINSKNTAQIYAKNYLLLHQSSNEILIQKNELQKVPIASTTKIMTATLVIEEYNLNDVITVSQKAAGQIGSETYLVTGEKISVINLLHCLLIMSGNDSAYALAENYPGGVEAFVNRMNIRAKELGMVNTHYLDPAGLNPEGYSTALDLSIITRFALKNDVFAEIVKTPETKVTDASGSRIHDLKNSNRLVNEFNYFGALGVKTGYLPEAGHCLVAVAERDGQRLIAIILNTNSDTPTASAIEARKLLDYGFSNYYFE